MNLSDQKYLNTFFDGLRCKVVISNQEESNHHESWIANEGLLWEYSIWRHKNFNKNILNKDEIKTDVLKFKEYLAHNTVQKDFKWIIQHLISPTNSIKGWEIYFPESVFFSRSGKVSFMIK